MFGIEKVVINKNSWHYQWLKRWHLAGPKEESVHNYILNPITREKEWVSYRIVERAPKSICPYFWLLMFTFFAILAGTGMTVVVVSAAVFILTSFLVVVAAFLYWLFRYDLKDVFTVVEFLVGFVLLITLLVGLNKLRVRLINRPYKE